MGLTYQNLDGETRRLMLDEINMDGDALYRSNYLNEIGQERWPELLRNAAVDGSDDSLASALREGHCFKQKTERRKPKGGVTMVSVPHTAAQTLAESQFNMYYIRALARRAIEEGLTITVYRAKEVEHSRQESEEMISTQLDPQYVLEELRRTHGVEPATGIPMPNSGITIQLG